MALQKLAHCALSCLKKAAAVSIDAGRFAASPAHARLFRRSDTLWNQNWISWTSSWLQKFSVEWVQRSGRDGESERFRLSTSTPSCLWYVIISWICSILFTSTQLFMTSLLRIPFSTRSCHFHIVWLHCFILLIFLFCFEVFEYWYSTLGEDCWKLSAREFWMVGSAPPSNSDICKCSVREFYWELDMVVSTPLANFRLLETLRSRMKIAGNAPPCSS